MTRSPTLRTLISSRSRIERNIKDIQEKSEAKKMEVSRLSDCTDSC